VDVDLRFTISRLRRLTQLNNAGSRPSRMLTGNSRRGEAPGNCCNVRLEQVYRQVCRRTRVRFPAGVAPAPVSGAAFAEMRNS
jgi:hypothetical protein